MRQNIDRIALLGMTIVSAASAAAGCATPAPIYRLTPRSNDVFWVAGRPSIQKESAGVRAAVAFEHQDGNGLRLRVEMINQTGARLDVKPADFSYVTCTGETVASCGVGKPIVDPELVLSALDEREVREQADAVNGKAVLVPLMLLSVAADVGEIANGRHGHRVGSSTAAVAYQMDREEARHDSALQSIDTQRELWSNAAFRRNTLGPGDGTAGFVTIPIEPDVKYVWFTVRAGGQILPFCFQQSARRVITSSPAATSAGHGYNQ